MSDASHDLIDHVYKNLTDIYRAMIETEDFLKELKVIDRQTIEQYFQFYRKALEISINRIHDFKNDK